MFTKLFTTSVIIAAASAVTIKSTALASTTSEVEFADSV